MPRILIPGGAAFFGSHLGERFLAEGDDVICMDNSLTGTPDNVAHLFADRRFTFIQQDVTTYIYVKGPLDAILHFASPASPVDYLELPIQTLKVGSLGTHKALGLAKEKSARFLLASTSEVYGDPLVHPQKEDYWGHVNPILPFAERIKPLTGSKSEIVFRPLPEDDPRVRQPDITKARTLLGWEPRVALEDGLRRTIDFFRPVVRKA